MRVFHGHMLSDRYLYGERMCCTLEIDEFVGKLENLGRI